MLCRSTALRTASALGRPRAALATLAAMRTTFTGCTPSTSSSAALSSTARRFSASGIATRLSDVAKVALLQRHSAPEIRDIWRQYHRDQHNAVGGVLTTSDFDELMAKARIAPTSLTPVMVDCSRATAEAARKAEAKSTKIVDAHGQPISSLTATDAAGKTTGGAADAPDPDDVCDFSQGVAPNSDGGQHYNCVCQWHLDMGEGARDTTSDAEAETRRLRALRVQSGGCNRDMLNELRPETRLSRSVLHCSFAFLDDYKKDPARAPSYMTLSFFPELADSHGLVLVRGDVLQRQMLTRVQSKQLARTCIASYLDPTLWQHARAFATQARSFDYGEWISALKRKARG